LSDDRHFKLVLIIFMRVMFYVNA